MIAKPDPARRAVTYSRLDLATFDDGLNLSDQKPTLRVDSEQELTYFRNQGVLPYAVRKTVGATRAVA